MRFEPLLGFIRFDSRFLRRSRRLLQARFHLLQVVSKLFDRLLPQRRIPELIRVRPVTFGKLGGDVTRIAAELEYVPLREANMFEHLPRRIGQPINLPVA